MLVIFLNTVHVLVALFMILVVLVQGGNQGGVGAALGGGSNAGSAFGATGATSLLGKLTYGAAIVFMITTISLTILHGHAGKRGIADQLSKQATPAVEPASPAAAKETAPAAQPVPATEATPVADPAPATVPAPEGSGK